MKQPMPRPKLVHGCLGAGLWAVVLSAPPCAAAGAGEGEGGPVAAGQTVAEILRAEPSRPASGPREDPAAMGSRTGLWAGLVAALGGSLLLIARRRSKRAALPGASEEIQVVGRAAISHKHAVVVLRVAGRRIVIGVTGDRMTPLAVVDEPPADSGKGRGVSARGDERAGPSVPPEARRTAGRMKSSDLAPYRRQVDRLKILLQGPLRDAAREIGGRSA